jgi:hypothetical protein
VDPHDVVGGALTALSVGSVATIGSVTGKPRMRDAPRRMPVDGAFSSVLALPVIVQGLDELAIGHGGATLDASLSRPLAQLLHSLLLEREVLPVFGLAGRGLALPGPAGCAPRRGRLDVGLVPFADRGGRGRCEPALGRPTDAGIGGVAAAAGAAARWTGSRRPAAPAPRSARPGAPPGDRRARWRTRLQLRSVCRFVP